MRLQFKGLQGNTKKDVTIDQTRERAEEQIRAAKLRAEKEMERVSKQATRAMERSRRTVGQNPLAVGAIAGTAILGGLAAWMLGRKRR